jgi:hypothetical protein
VLAGQMLYYLSHAPVLFCFSCILEKVLCVCLGLASDHNPPTYASRVDGITGMNRYASPGVEF